MLGLLPFQGAAAPLNQNHRALPWAKSKPCPLGAQTDKQLVDLRSLLSFSEKSRRFFRAFRVRKKKGKRIYPIYLISWRINIFAIYF